VYVWRRSFSFFSLFFDEPNYQLPQITPFFFSPPTNGPSLPRGGPLVTPLFLVGVDGRLGSLSFFSIPGEQRIFPLFPLSCKPSLFVRRPSWNACPCTQDRQRTLSPGISFSPPPPVHAMNEFPFFCLFDRERGGFFSPPFSPVNRTSHSSLPPVLIHGVNLRTARF